uniref:Adhesion G-protein coupled receptor G2 n=1 Tax=Cyprinus carpio TaxID=7962 RepID=A0A8C2FTB0_CYPCA
MVWCVCTDHDVKHSRLSVQVSTRGMATKGLSRWSFGFWSQLDYVFFLVLLLLCLPVTSSISVITVGFSDITTPTGPPNSTTVTEATTDNITTMQSSTTEGLSGSSTVPLTTSHVTVQNTTTMVETTATFSSISTTIPATTFTMEFHSTDNQTVETTPYTTTENTTSFETTASSTSTENMTSFETTTSFTSTENMTFETTTSSTSTENMTSFETTASSTSTETITSFETNANFTTFTATTEPSSSASITDSTPLLTTVKQTPSVFYWMTISYEVTVGDQSEQNLKTMFEWFFKGNLDTCAVFHESSSFVMSQSESISVKVFYNELPSSYVEKTGLFEAMEFTCEPKNITKNAQCNILLKLSAPVSVCCMMKLTVTLESVVVVGQIERVGVCADDITHFLAGQYNKCNETVKVTEDVCSVKPQNILCGNSTNVIFPLDTGVQEICPTMPPPPTCTCSSHCNNSDFYYYHFNITWSTEIFYAKYEYPYYKLRKSVYQLLNHSECSNILSACNSVQTFRNHIQDIGVNYFTESTFQVIVKLDRAMDLCDVHTAVEAIFEPQKSFTFDGVVSRVAICSYSLDPLRDYFIWKPSLSTNFSSEGFCMESNRENLLTDYCLRGLKYLEGNVGIVIPLNGSCNSSTPMFQNITTTSPSFTVSTTTSGALDAEGLLKLSAKAPSLNATQVEQILSQLESLLSGPNISLALANTSINIVSNLLNVPVAVMTPFSKRAIGIVDTVGLKLVVSGTSQSILSQSLAMAVKKVDGTNFQETSFSLIETSNVQIQSHPSLETEDIMVQVRSTLLGSIILPASLTQNLTAEQQRLASRVQFSYFQKSTFFQDKNLGESKLNSGIVGCSVANLSISGLQKEVVITLRNTGPIPANYKASCVFWDFGLNGGSGGWNRSGCHVLNSSAEETQCACNHLTSFGILLDISKTPITGQHAEILTYITYIGCGISAIFLSVTLLTYLAFGKLRKDIPSKILIQLCLALLLLNLVFLLDAWLALYPDAVGLCISTAFFLHYFLLASFTWMALEAFHMYLAIVKVFNTYISRFMVKIGLVGWGIPLVIVIIVIAFNKDNYGLVTYGRFGNGATDDFCWIKNDIVFYVAVVAYFCLVFLLNFIMFIIVMVQLCRIKQQNPHNVQNRSGWQEIRSVAGLSMLLGLTWGFAFFAWGPVNLAFMYLFAIFNTLQGFFIFVFHCAMKENVRRQWRTYLCCGSLRLAENSDWSRTATQKKNKASKKRMFSFRSSNSNNSSSSFLNHDSLASDMPMDVGNPMDDRKITAAEKPSSGSDVVLNEINNQYRGQRS